MLQKFTSRKLLVAIIGMLTGILIVANGDVDKGITLIMTSIVTYIGAESYIDGKSTSNNGFNYYDDSFNSNGGDNDECE